MVKYAGVFGGHSHTNFSNTNTLTRLFEKIGYEILEHETIITEIGVIKNYLSFQDPHLGYGSKDILYITLEFIYKNNIARNINIVEKIKK